ncbi:MAG: DUF2878 domain-containing protein [Woeseiaceae bacterium]|nr:DUF2878 domain-containing protein [Woeseiaceae bacterium]
MLLLTNVVAFEVAWFASVFGGANQMPWLGPLAVLAVLLFHFQAARKPFEEMLLVCACAIIGATFDSLLVAAGWVTFSSGVFSDYLTPYWIITMWMLFGTTLNVSMRWLRRKPLSAAAVGFIGGPVAYLAGEKLGGISLTEPVLAIAALGFGWAAILPLLVRLSEDLDGMPGRRRNWIAEPVS